jgi:cAMP-dependent protein kinase regulator
MNKERISYKEEAQRALSRGDWKKALESFQKHCAKEPKDLRSKLKVAELLEKLGKKSEAIQVYREVAEVYAQDGFLLQAISVNKMILRIDPSAKDANDRLAQLYTEKVGETKPLRPLPHIPLFSELNEKELQSLLDHIQVKTFSKDTLICREGERGDSLMVIIRGEVAVSKRNPEGKEVWIRNLKEGDFFGEFGFFIGQKRHANIKALMECEILEMSRNELDEIIKTHPRMKEVLQNLFKKRVLDLFLAFSPLFSSLTSTEREEVFKQFRLKKVPEEALLFQEGGPPGSLYMVKSGEVEIFIQNRRGQKVVLETQKSGNFFGELSLLLNKPQMVNAKTTQPSELLELTKEDFEALLHKFPGLQSTVKEISSKRLVRIKGVLSQEGIEKVREAMV